MTTLSPPPHFALDRPALADIDPVPTELGDHHIEIDLAAHLAQAAPAVRRHLIVEQLTERTDDVGHLAPMPLLQDCCGQRILACCVEGTTRSPARQTLPNAASNEARSCLPGPARTAPRRQRLNRQPSGLVSLSGCRRLWQRSLWHAGTRLTGDALPLIIAGTERGRPA
jgi:hypothetical protein